MTLYLFAIDSLLEPCYSDPIEPVWKFAGGFFDNFISRKHSAFSIQPLICMLTED